MMDELDLRLLAQTRREQAISLARLAGLDDLATELGERDLPDRRANIFMALRDAKISVRDAARVAGIPPSTAQAAALGKANCGLTKGERDRLNNYLRNRIKMLQRAQRILEWRLK